MAEQTTIKIDPAPQSKYTVWIGAYPTADVKTQTIEELMSDVMLAVKTQTMAEQTEEAKDVYEDAVDATMAFLRDKAAFDARRKTWLENPLSKHHYACFRSCFLRKLNLCADNIQADDVESEVKSAFVSKKRKERDERKKKSKLELAMDFLLAHPLYKASEAARIEAQIEAEWAAMSDEQKLEFIQNNQKNQK
jgi:hypothetical protein